MVHTRTWLPIIFLLCCVQQLVYAGSISGKITNAENGAPVIGAKVEAQRPDFETYSAITDVSGNYTITVPLSNNDKLAVRANMTVSSPLADQYYGGDLFFPGIWVEPTEAAPDVTGIDIALIRGYSVIGQVSDSGGHLADVDIDVYFLSGTKLKNLTTFNASTTSNGFYEVGPLPNGSYFVLADPDPLLGQTHVPAFYGDTSDIDLATPIVISDKAETGKDIELFPGGVISGIISNTVSSKLKKIDLDVFNTNGDFLPYSAITVDDGTYALIVPEGDYFIRADPGNNSNQESYARLYYPNGFTLAEGKQITVTLGSTTADINFVLPESGTLSGTIRDVLTLNPIAGVDLDFFDSEGGALTVTALTEFDGSYFLDQLPTGSYLVKADPSRASGYVAQFYDGMLTKTGATLVSIVAGADTLDIDFDLSLGGFINGTIRDTGGTPLEGIDLDIYDALGARMDATALTAVDGTYSVGPLPDGDYYVRADADPLLGQFFKTTYYGGTTERSLATLVTLTAGSVSGIDIAMEAGGAISGIIRESGGLPLADFDLDIFDVAGNKLLYNASSRLNGSYVMGPLPAGNYILLCDPSAGSPYTELYYDGASSKGSATLITVVEGALTSNIDFNLVSGGAITGTVSDGSGTPLDGVDMDVFDATGAYIAVTATTAVDGTYSLGPIADGDYFVRADPDPVLGQYFTEAFFGGDADIANASLITVTGGSATGIDISLEAGGIISGTIRGTGGEPLAGVDLDLYDSLGARLSFSARSVLDGTYAIGPLPAGFYFLKSDPAEETGYTGLYFDGGLAKSSAISIEVIVGTTTSSVNFDHVQGGYISGTIRDTGGTPLAGIDLDIFDVAGAFIDVSTRTNTDGTYTLGPLAVGEYLVRGDADAELGQFNIDTYYGGTSDILLATPVTVGVGVTSGIDINMGTGGIITGTVRNLGEDALPGIDLDLFDEDGKRLTHTATSQADGSYAIGPLPAGLYLLKSDPADESGYTGLYYDDAVAKSGSAPVSVSIGVETTTIDFDLFQGGWISGTIRNEEGTALADVDLDVFDSLGARMDATTKSTIDGTFTVGPFPPGDYFVKADPDDMTGYLPTFYPDAFERADGTAVTVTASATVPGIDFSLAVAGWIEGLVTDELGAPLVAIDLDAFNAETLERLTQGGITGADGRYIIGPMPVGEIIVRADPTIEQRRVREYFTEAIARRTASPVTVVGGVGTMNVDFSLEPGSFISGRVIDPDDGNPVAGVDIDVFRVSDMFQMDQNAKTQADGSYVVGPLPEGTYIIKFDARSSSSYLDIYYDGTEDVSSAVPIVLTTDMNVSGIDSILPEFTLYPEVTFGDGGSGFSFSFQTQIGKNYSVEYSDILMPDSWTTLTTIVGDGLVTSYEIEVSPGISRRFYQIRISSF